jgi:hypothetical protein
VAKFTGANDLIESHLRKYLEELEAQFDADCLTYFGPIGFGADDDIKDAIESIEDKKKRLLVILETGGGFAETARRIADTFRHHYESVEFLVPSYAMSAGTILVMSGDAIHMDYYSVLGPIDPQVEGPNGKFIPALGYLIKYEELLKKANKGKISQAEGEILMSFDQGQLYLYEQAHNLSVSLLEEWLCKFKWKNWTQTETRKIKVTEAMKKKKAKEIAKKLNDVDLWNSHGIGINMDRLTHTLGLKIDDFGKEDAFTGKKSRTPLVRKYHRLLTDYMTKMRHTSAVHTKNAYRPTATAQD